MDTPGADVGGGKANGKIKNRKNCNFDVRNGTRETEKRNRYLFIFLPPTETAKSLTTVAVLYNAYCIYRYTRARIVVYIRIEMCWSYVVEVPIVSFANAENNIYYSRSCDFKNNKKYVEN